MSLDSSACRLVVPIRSFARAKGRLAGVLGDDDRAALARLLADRLLTAADGLAVVVACEDEDVAGWAEAAGATVAWTPGLGLSGSVQTTVDRLAEDGVHRVVVAHADLADPPPLTPLALADGVVLVPDRLEDGTNIVSVPTAARFTFAYGPDSFRRHLAMAEATGLPVTVVRDVPGWAWDIDHPEDLDLPEGFRPLELP